MSKRDLKVVDGDGPVRVDAETDDRAAALGLGPKAGYNDWLWLGDELAAQYGETTWAAADWLAYGAARWAEERVADAAERLGISLGKISNYVLVSNTYGSFARRKSLSFSHHLDVVRLPEAERERILDEASANGWTRAQMREAVREARRKKAVRLRPDPDTARDVAARYRARVEAQRRIVASDIGRLARLGVEAARSEELEALHGNARRGLARDLRRSFSGIAEKVRSHRADAAVVLARIEGDDAHPLECTVSSLVDEIEPILRLVGERIARAAKAGDGKENRVVLAGRVEAKINARMESMVGLFSEIVGPALRQLAGPKPEEGVDGSAETG